MQNIELKQFLLQFFCNYVVQIIIVPFILK